MEIQDGSAKFIVRDKRMKAMIDMFYPVGSVYATVSDTKPEFMNYGTWEEIAKGRVLQGVNDNENAGDTKEAGLPNIKGRLQRLYGENFSDSYSNDSALRLGVGFSKLVAQAWESSGVAIEFDASSFNPIYGNSNTVQPLAYLVHYYKRIS